MTQEKLIRLLFYAALAGGAWYLYRRYRLANPAAIATTRADMLTISENEMAQAMASFKPF